VIHGLAIDDWRLTDCRLAGRSTPPAAPIANSQSVNPQSTIVNRLIGNLQSPFAN